MNIYHGWRTEGRVYVTCNGMELLPDLSLSVRNHSPSGFEWAYCGSGPAQLALAILLHELPVYLALACYMDFKRDVIAQLDYEEWQLTEQQIAEAINARCPRNTLTDQQALDLSIGAMPPTPEIGESTNEAENLDLPGQPL